MSIEFQIITKRYLKWLSCSHKLFFNCFRWARALDTDRALQKKNMCFVYPARALDCCRFPKKQILRKNKLISGEFFLFSYVFFWLVVFVAHFNYYQNRSNVFISSPSLTFPEICPMLLCLVALFNWRDPQLQVSENYSDLTKLEVLIKNAKPNRFGIGGFHK